MTDRARLFVYGTLRRGATHDAARRLFAHVRGAMAATVSGRLYDLGAYPGMVLDATASTPVHGELLELADPELLWPILDGYEGCGVDDPLPHEFVRTKTRVRVGGGREVEATVYVYALPASGRPVIASGDWTSG